MRKDSNLSRSTRASLCRKLQAWVSCWLTNNNIQPEQGFEPKIVLYLAKGLNYAAMCSRAAQNECPLDSPHVCICHLAICGSDIMTMFLESVFCHFYWSCRNSLSRVVSLRRARIIWFEYQILPDYNTCHVLTPSLSWHASHVNEILLRCHTNLEISFIHEVDFIMI